MFNRTLRCYKLFPHRCLGIGLDSSPDSSHPTCQALRNRTFHLFVTGKDFMASERELQGFLGHLPVSQNKFPEVLLSLCLNSFIHSLLIFSEDPKNWPACVLCFYFQQVGVWHGRGKGFDGKSEAGTIFPPMFSL